MEKTRSHLATVLVSALFVVPSCTSPKSEEPPFTPQYSTERLRIATEFEEAICRGQIDLWEAQVDLIEQDLGGSRSYVWIDLFTDVEQLTEACHFSPDIGQIGGCWSGSVIYSTSNKVAHELVHAWTMVTNHEPLPLLREGLADRMAGAVLRWTGPRYTRSNLLQATLAVHEYTPAAHFVAWLMATYGTERFLDLYANTFAGMAEADLDEAIRMALGQELDAVLGSFMAADDLYFPAMGSQACGRGEKIAWTGDAALWSEHGSCSDGPFLGFQGSAWQRIAIDIPVSGNFVLDTNGRPAAMTRCLTLPTRASDVVTSDFPVTDDWNNSAPLQSMARSFGLGKDEDWSDLTLALTAGTYEIWIDRNYDAAVPIPMTMSLRRI